MFRPALTINDVLQQYSDKEIFEYYLNKSVNENDVYYAPYRSDKNPSCTFTKRGGKWLFRDWGHHHKGLDCFDFVQFLFNINFVEALEKIYFDLDLDVPLESKQVQFSNNTPFKKPKPIFNVETQAFTKQDKRYLTSYGINLYLCNKYNIFSIKRASVNNYFVYERHSFDPCLGYYLGKDKKNNPKWKLYFYKRNDNRFKTNTFRIQGWIQLPKKYPILINTKSMKDVCCLDKLGYPSIAPQCENFIYYDYIINELKDRFNKIITLYDNDDTGIKYSKTLFDQFNIPYVFLQEAKDISDLISTKGILYAKQKLNKLLKTT